MTDSFCCLKTPHWGSAQLQSVSHWAGGGGGDGGGGRGPQLSPLLLPAGVASVHVVKRRYTSAQLEHSLSGLREFHTLRESSLSLSVDAI